MQTNRTPVSTSFLLALLGILVIIAGPTAATAQLSVQMKLNNSDYIAHESVRATVTVSNRAGQDVVLPQGWLTFDVYNGTRMISGHRGAKSSVTPFVLAAGKTITKEIDISSLYPVYNWGNYKVNASVYFPPLRNYFSSAPQRFSVTDPKPFWTQSIGVSRGRDKLSSFRLYEIIEHRGITRTEIYVRLKDTKGGRVYATYSLGRYINITRPQATVDSQNRLHVMHMVGRQIYQHSTVSPEGSFLGAKLFKTAGRSRPELMIDAGGSVKVKGGTPHNPQTARTSSGTATGRMATDRPAGLPQ